MFDALLARIAQALDERAIPYMVIGGQAVLLDGEPDGRSGLIRRPGGIPAF
ncbi:MAG: hypothetical protein MUF27_01765 [Acidobacteria bacterium]|jgi:hypothetical protein|nr:hypothetical protein [Acidobacteriota bacterium]